MSFIKVTRNYLVPGIEGTPETLSELLKDLPDEAAFWNFRPDPNRFTPREVVAHLAEWDAIFDARIRRTLAEHQPMLPDVDEGQLALDHDYAHAAPLQQLRLFRERRDELTAFLRDLNEEDFQRVGIREPLGPLSIETQTALILGHDAYHLRQTAQYLIAYRAQ